MSFFMGPPRGEGRTRDGTPTDSDGDSVRKVRVMIRNARNPRCAIPVSRENAGQAPSFEPITLHPRASSATIAEIVRQCQTSFGVVERPANPAFEDRQKVSGPIQSIER